MVIFFLQKHTCLKSINLGRKILELEQPTIDWLRNVIHYSGFSSLCVAAYMTINHGSRLMPPTSFYQGKITEPIGREVVVEMMVTHLGADPTKTSNEVVGTRGAHARFSFF